MSVPSTPSIPNQTLALFQQSAGTNDVISSKHGPALRIMGFVNDANDVDPPMYAPLGALYAHDAGLWKLVGKMGAMGGDEELAFITRTIDDTRRRIEADFATVAERKANCSETKTADYTALNATPDATPDATAPDATPDDVDGPPRVRCQPVPRDLEMRGQRFAAMGVIQSDECTLVNMFGATDTVEACRAWIATTLAEKHPICDIFVVEMYAWVYPDTLRLDANTASIPFKYHGEGGDELTEIMQGSIDETKRCMEFKSKVGVDESYPIDMVSDMKNIDMDSDDIQRRATEVFHRAFTETDPPAPELVGQ